MAVFWGDAQVVEGKQQDVQTDPELFPRGVHVNITPINHAPVFVAGFRCLVPAEVKKSTVSALVGVTVDVTTALSGSACLFAAGVPAFASHRTGPEVIASAGVE
ncbi:hypothetical protein DYI20_02725 [Auritidibacter ignavus]|nr:hypothetical protein DYI20_02725 [Auritidibacter ignavus]